MSCWWGPSCCCRRTRRTLPPVASAAPRLIAYTQIGVAKSPPARQLYSVPGAPVAATRWVQGAQSDVRAIGVHDLRRCHHAVRPGRSGPPATDSDSLSGLQWTWCDLHARSPRHHAECRRGRVVRVPLRPGLRRRPTAAERGDAAGDCSNKCRPSRARWPSTATTATARTPPAPWPRRSTASASPGVAPKATIVVIKAGNGRRVLLHAVRRRRPQVRRRPTPSTS